MGLPHPQHTHTLGFLENLDFFHLACSLCQQTYSDVLHGMLVRSTLVNIVYDILLDWFSMLLKRCMSRILTNYMSIRCPWLHEGMIPCRNTCTSRSPVSFFPPCSQTSFAPLPPSTLGPDEHLNKFLKNCVVVLAALNVKVSHELHV